MRIPGVKTVKRFSRWVRARASGGAMILGYHRVLLGDSDGYNIGVTPAHFAGHLEILRRYTQPLHLAELASRLQQGTLPPNAVAVTFDDGYADNLHNALPLLERNQIPATVFSCTEYLGKGFWWDELSWLIQSPSSLPDELQLRTSVEAFEWRSSGSSKNELLNSLHRHLFSMDVEERNDVIEKVREWSLAPSYDPTMNCALTPDELLLLARSGLVQIGSHTRTHPVLSSLPVERQKEEIALSRKQLEGILDRPVLGFAYPNGSSTLQTREIVREAGYHYACCSEMDLVRDPRAMYQLPRFWPTDVDGDRFLRNLRIWLKI